MSKPNKDLSPKDIIIAFQNQEWSILENIIKQYTGYLLRGAFSLGYVGNQADDLVQNVWSTFFEILPRFEGNSQIKTFLYGIMINKVREQKREDSKNQKHDPIDKIMEDRFDSNGHWVKPPINPEQFLETSQTLEIIYDCIEKLPVTQRAAFVLWEIDGNETPEICKILDVTVTNLGVLLYRAKNRLRECIEIKTKR